MTSKAWRIAAALLILCVPLWYYLSPLVSNVDLRAHGMIVYGVGALICTYRMLRASKAELATTIDEIRRDEERERERYAMSRLRQDAEPEWCKLFGMTQEQAQGLVKQFERFDWNALHEPRERYVDPYDALEAENERLRDALMRVIDCIVLEDGKTWKDTANEIGMIAHDAFMTVDGEHE